MLNLGSIKDATPKETKNSTLDSLLDHAFDNCPPVFNQKDTETKNQKKKVTESPSLEIFQELKREVQMLRNSTPSPIFGNANDRENIIAIFSHLKLPNLPVPNESNISQFLNLLRGLLDRTSGLPSSGTNIQ
jgi:hypothetical protein